MMTNILRLLNIISIIVIICHIDDALSVFRHANIRGIHKDAQMFYKEFTSKIPPLDYKINMGFADLSYLKNYTVGLTIHPLRTIVFHTPYWQGADITTRRLVAYHELGHLVLNKRHNDEKRADGCPQSIMHASLPTSECIDKYKEEYEQELFRR
jgi:hypothetical protein